METPPGNYTPLGHLSPTFPPSTLSRRPGPTFNGFLKMSPTACTRHTTSRSHLRCPSRYWKHLHRCSSSPTLLAVSASRSHPYTTSFSTFSSPHPRCSLSYPSGSRSRPSRMALPPRAAKRLAPKRSTARRATKFSMTQKRVKSRLRRKPSGLQEVSSA